MVEDALREGKSIAFFKNIQKYEIELWENKYLFDIIANDTVYATGERCDAHYDLVRDIINISIESRLSFWQDDDTMYQWIHLLVEQKYPWFVCSLWNHLRPTAISFLHDASMMHCHTGNLHQLLRQNCIASLWETDDFMHSVTDQALFFNTLEKRKNKSFLKTVKTQLSHYPYTEPSYVRITIEALCLRKSLKIFRCFVNHEQAQYVKDEHVDFILLNLCKNGMVLLFEDMFHQMYNDECTPSIHNWFTWFHCIYDSNSSDSWKKRSSSELCNMFMSLLKLFDMCMPAQAWCELLTQVSNVPILQMCMHTKYANKIYTQMLFYLRRAIQSLPDTFTTVIVNSTDNEPTTIEWSSIEQEKDFFLIVDSLLVSSQGWTSFANALRWGNRECVQWMLEQCKEDDKSFLLNTLCKTSSHPSRYDNPLTLAMYNPDLSILHLVVHAVNDDKQLHDWCCQCECRSIIIALARVSFFHTNEQVKQRWKLITTLYPSISTYKSEMVEAFLNEWHEHTRIFDQLDHEKKWNELEESFLFREIMRLPCPLDVLSAQYALTSVRVEWSAFHHRMKTILKYGGMKDVIGTYIALVSTECVCLPHLYAFESYDVFKNALVHTNTSLYKMVFAWSQRSMNELNYFVKKLAERWNQNIHAILPPDYSYYACTDHCIYTHESRLKEQWGVWLDYGLLPLIMYRSNSTLSVPNILNLTLKAYRMLRRCLQRRWKKLHTSTPLYINHKKIMFMVRCDDSLFPNKRQKIQS